MTLLLEDVGGTRHALHRGGVIESCSESHEVFLMFDVGL